MQCIKEGETDLEAKGEKEMSEPKFARGPWKAVEEYRYIFVSTGSVVICECGNTYEGKGHKQEQIAMEQANAALIAAAPEMYDWLNWLIEMDMTVASPNDKEKIKNVLKKARGVA